VVVDGVDVGILCVTRREDHLFLGKVALLPPYQGRGVGTELVKTVLDQGRGLALPVRLQVLKANRARALYERLGFAECGETETHYLMVWPAVEQARGLLSILG
jgi:GNAT superfamily N-acetyltransferase